MEASILSSPLFQSAALPLVVTLVACGLIRLVGGQSRGSVVAGAALAIGFLAAYVAISGVPAFPPRASSQKLAYLVLAGVLIGMALDLLRAGRNLDWTMTLVALGLSIAWLGWPRLRSADPVNAGMAAVVWIGCGIALIRLYALRDRGSDGTVLLLVTALGVAGIAFFGRTASYAQLGGALAAASGGFMVWNWPLARFPLGAAAVLGAGGALAAMVTNMVFYTKSSALAIVCLLPIFFADAVADQVPLPRGVLGQSLRPVVLALLAAIPVSLAVGVGAYLNS
jgi:hypothetical protein